MKRSVQEIVELLVFGLIALLIGTGLLWLTGWMFDLVGGLFKFFAGLIWALLRFIVPVALVAAIAYLLVKLLQQGRRDSSPHDEGAPPVGTATTNTTAVDAVPPRPSTSPEVVGPADPVVPEPNVNPWQDPSGSSAASAPTTEGSEAWAAPQPAPPADEAIWPDTGAPDTGPTTEVPDSMEDEGTSTSDPLRDRNIPGDESDRG